MRKPSKTAKVAGNPSVRKNIIPTGYGLGLPIGRNHDDSNSPLGLAIGEFTPYSAGGEFWNTYSKPFLQSRVIQHKAGNYLVSITAADIAGVHDKIASLIHQVHFINELLRLSNNIDKHLNSVTTAFLNEALTGKLVALQRRAIAMLEGIPFPQKIYDAFAAGFEWTVVSDSPFSNIRGNIPRYVVPGFGTTLGAYTLGVRLQKSMDTIAAEAEKLQAMGSMFSALSLHLPDNSSSSDLTLRKATLQNHMNLPWTDTLDGSITLDAARHLYFRSTVEEDGLFTVSYVDTDSTPDIALGSIWTVTTDTLTGTAPICYIDNEGKVQPATNSADDLANFGMFNGGTVIDNISSYDTSYVKATAGAVLAGVADRLFA